MVGITHSYEVADLEQFIDNFTITLESSLRNNVDELPEFLKYHYIMQVFFIFQLFLIDFYTMFYRKRNKGYMKNISLVKRRMHRLMRTRLSWRIYYLEMREADS